jgi:hypothetical protein
LGFFIVVNIFTIKLIWPETKALLLVEMKIYWAENKIKMSREEEQPQKKNSSNLPTKKYEHTTYLLMVATDFSSPFCHPTK